MTVEELFRQLSYGELSNLAVAVDATGTLKKEQRNRVLYFINEALMRLHTRFPLSQQIVNVTVGDVELIEQLPDGTLQILAILDDQGNSFVPETSPNPKAIYVYENELHIPIRIIEPSTPLQIILQMRHPELLPITVDSDLDQTVTLMPELHAALAGYVASKLYATMNTPESVSAANNFMAQYEATCADVQMRGLIPAEMLPLQKFERRGWV